MRKRCLVVLIVEDDRQQMLLRRYLLKCGLSIHEIRVVRSPAGQGSAEQWVRKTFVREVRVYRRRHAETKLVVVLDADTNAVEIRIRQLEEGLKLEGEEQIRTDERIARLIPKRNVETWVLCLNLQVVDEETDYKRSRHNWHDLMPAAAVALFDWSRPNVQVPPSATESLRRGLMDLSRAAFSYPKGLTAPFVIASVVHLR